MGNGRAKRVRNRRRKSTTMQCCYYCFHHNNSSCCKEEQHLQNPSHQLSFVIRHGHSTDIVKLLKFLNLGAKKLLKGPITTAEFHHHHHHHQHVLSPTSNVINNEDTVSSFSYRGICATRHIPKNELILHLPEALLITSQAFPTSFLPNDFSVHEKFTCFLLQEFVGKGVESKYLPYLQTLPLNFNEHPCYLSTDVRSLLPLWAQEPLRIQMNEIVECWRKLSKYLEEHDDGKKLLLSEQIDFEQYKWAWYAVNTRTVFYVTSSGDKEMALAPFLDLINHTPEPNTRVEFVERPGEKGYTIKSSRAIKMNEEIFLSYGSHSNLKLWSEYGFVPFRHNPYDFLPLEYEWICRNFSSFASLEKDARKRKLLDLYHLRSELNLMEKDLSPNLTLLIGVALWVPERDGNFDFNTSIITQDLRAKRIVGDIVNAELESCKDSLGKLRAMDDIVKTSSSRGAEVFLKSCIGLLDNLTCELGLGLIGFDSSSMEDVLSPRPLLAGSGLGEIT
jgi:hypothetical protein